MGSRCCMIRYVSLLSPPHQSQWNRKWIWKIPSSLFSNHVNPKGTGSVSLCVSGYHPALLGHHVHSIQRRCFRPEKEVVVVEDDTYGNKEVISLTPRLYHYILSNVREPQILRLLREETASIRGSQMQVSPDQAQLLAMLVRILGAQRCIEVGVYTGYSSLAVALVLPESGRLVACERDARSLELAKKYYQLAGIAHKVDVRHGLAADTLKSLILNGESDCYDFAFVDAEKRMNQEYFELLLKLVRKGGVIVVDNVLWHGKVADPVINDPKTISIRNFNKELMDDDRISISMVPIGDGLTICHKR